MTQQQTEHINLQLLSDIDQIIHTPARLMVLSYLYVVKVLITFF